MRLAVSSLGMITSIGLDTANSCAALRAGIKRTYPIDHFTVLDDETQEETPILGCPIRGYTEGFNIVGLWVRVGIGCLQSLVDYGNLPDKADKRYWGSTGLIAVTPPVNDDRFGGDDTIDAETIKALYVYRLMDIFGFPLDRTNIDAICIGHAGGIAAIGKAQALMSERGLDRVIVLAVDSYMDPMTLDWLDRNDRLKSGENPVGITPGEAGACFMLELPASIRKRGATARACITGHAVALEKDHFFSGNASQGIGLTTAVSETLNRASVAIPFDGTIISDMNGEPWKAFELATARVRLADKLSDGAQFVYPCHSLGEVGAASAAVAVCAAVRSLERGYARNGSVLVVSSSDHGHVGAALVSTGGNGGG